MTHKMNRRALIKGIAAAAVAVPVVGIAGGTNALAATASTDATTSDSLAFDPDAYTEITTTISTDDGDKEVTYHFWSAITYVTDPVDETYQSLTVSVPVSIDGTAVDATDAPILVSNSIGGYLPSSVSTNTGVSSSRAQLAIAAGYVAVEPGARGRTLVDSGGDYYGTAPAAIVDLKAAIRYVRYNAGTVPGDTDKIVTAGTSAGGALSALLGASGGSSLYDDYLSALGAADADDVVYATGAWCPITDLENADGAYEWNWGTNTLSSGDEVDQDVSADLKALFETYQSGLGLTADDYGTITADNLDDYLLATYLEPAATSYLADLSDDDRTAYLSSNTFITWDGSSAAFSWSDYLDHVGSRGKDAPAFDAFDLSAGENNEFGVDTTEARHFTDYSLANDTSGTGGTSLDSDIPGKLDMMNPMYFIGESNDDRAKYWWIRTGTKDTDTALTIVGNLALSLENLGDDVNALMYWDAAHGADEDPGDFITWIGDVTGYTG
ncbi:subtype B tannase [Streptomyces sp. GbtcB6]|uniref:subtype B tannase n=1 Tax=Streptomyces sp. GbtcB6 TaxID=2824751 RepID=UPI0020C646BD|nr:subtype B tannase [Streptomyces sp. GbtcB6]